MMIQCSECGSTISDKANACPSCGAPGQTARTIEATGKKWKLITILGIVATVCGIVGCVAQASNPATQSEAVMSTWLCMGGIALWISGRIGAWWYHG